MQNAVLGIIGHPISHTLSPLMHNAAAQALSLQYVYAAFDVKPENLKKSVEAFRMLGIRGLNVTVPHKVAVMKYIDALDEEATGIGAVNTILNNDGVMTGYNTDGIGFTRSLKSEGFSPKGKKVALIGAGGSARAIGVSLLKAGASNVTVINRSKPGGARLARELSGFGNAEFALASGGDAGKIIGSSDLVVQTTPMGMKKNDPLPIADTPVEKGQLVYDIIYSPFETRFLKTARDRGCRTINGLGMLVYQGSESFRIWTGKKFPEEKILTLLRGFIKKGK